MRRLLVTGALRVISLARTLVMWTVPLRLRAVKALVRSPDGRVLLVRHSYGSGEWMLPGGLVRRGESFVAAAAREMQEELGIDPPQWEFLAEFQPRSGLTRQRLGVFTSLVDPAAIVPNHEITETAFVDPTHPPERVSPATARRLGEYAAGRMTGGAW